MKTLMAVAEPSHGSLPVIMIVDSTPEQRWAWHEACKLVGVRHHFADVNSAVRRLTEGFAVAGVILDRDRQGTDEVTKEQISFVSALVQLEYKKPLVVANLADSVRLGGMVQDLRASGPGPLAELPLLLDRNDELACTEMLCWCLSQ